MDTEKLCSSVSETVHTLANEPSLGLYYVADHVQRSVPHLISGKQELSRLTELLRGADLDASFGLENVRAATADSTRSSFASIHRLAKNTLRAAVGVDGPV